MSCTQTLSVTSASHGECSGQNSSFRMDAVHLFDVIHAEAAKAIRRRKTRSIRWRHASRRHFLDQMYGCTSWVFGVFTPSLHACIS